MGVQMHLSRSLLKHIICSFDLIAVPSKKGAATPTDSTSKITPIPSSGIYLTTIPINLKMKSIKNKHKT